MIEKSSEKSRIEIHEDIIDLLCKYGSFTPSQVALMVDRFLRHWVNIIGKQLIKDPGYKDDLIKSVERVPSSKLTSIHIEKVHAEAFKSWCSYLGIEEGDMSSHLGKAFISAWQISKKPEIFNKRKTKRMDSL